MKSETPAHTALPWRVTLDRSPLYPEKGEIVGISSGNKHVASPNHVYSQAETVANAELICRAVNSHAAMVEALEHSENTLRSLEAVLATADADERYRAREEKRAANVHTNIIRMAQDAQKKARAALKLATEVSP